MILKLLKWGSELARERRFLQDIQKSNHDKYFALQKHNSLLIVDICRMPRAEGKCLFCRKHSEITEMSHNTANDLNCMEYHSGPGPVLLSLLPPLRYSGQPTPCHIIFYAHIPDPESNKRPF